VDPIGHGSRCAAARPPLSDRLRFELDRTLRQYGTPQRFSFRTKGIHMKIQSLGHVVIKVRDQQRAEAFYNGLLGIPIVARYAPLSMTFFSLGNHHDFAVAAVGNDAVDAPPNTPGLLHVAFKIGTRIEELRQAKGQLEASGVEVEAVDHQVTKSIYFKDPDGNTIELYVDASDVWKQQPEAVAQAAPLDL
jgi:catechol 2,3-dioxygenase